MNEASINLFKKLPYYYHHPTCYRILSAMSAAPTGNRGSSIHNSLQYGISNTRTDHHMTNSIGDANTNVGNVTNSNNTTINVGIDQESMRIQEWLSPLEPYKRHQDVGNRRIDGVGEWVLRRSEFESWYKCRDSSVNPTLLCYGVQGVGKTYIWYDTRVFPRNKG